MAAIKAALIASTEIPYVRDGDVFITAFENWIPIGVKGNYVGIKDGPETRTTGGGGTQTRIMNIILSNITPPVFPEIAVCQNDDGSKAIIVIRIPQSHQTPHAIMNNTQVYVRTGNINNHEEIIGIDRLVWLFENRKKREVDVAIFLEAIGSGKTFKASESC